MDSGITAALVGAIAGGVASLAVVRYSRRVEREPDIAMASFALASLAVRLRREVLEQYVILKEGHWIPSALDRQRPLLEELDAVLPIVKRSAPAAFASCLAARESLVANIVCIEGWLAGAPMDAIPTQLGLRSPSHHDIFCAALLAARALAELPNRQCADQARTLAWSVTRMRDEVRERLRPAVARLQAMGEAEREAWVREGTRLD